MKFSLLLALSLCSCAGTPRGWREARSGVGDAVSGRWSGEWVSRANGHRGGLKCVVEKKREGVWEFRYRATWAAVLAAGFTLEAAVVPAGRGRWKVEARKNLGPVFGGEFRSVATVTGDTFSASYDSSADRGVMTMRRVNP